MVYRLRDHSKLIVKNGVVNHFMGCLRTLSYELLGLFLKLGGADTFSLEALVMNFHLV